MTAFKTI